MITEPIVTSVQEQLSTRSSGPDLAALPGSTSKGPVGGVVIPGHSWEELLWARRELDAPKGWRTEILDGGIALTPWRRSGEVAIAARVHNTLLMACPETAGVFQSLSVEIPDRELLVMPDVAVTPLSSLDDTCPVPAQELEIAVEITAPGSARRDRTTKRLGYAQGPVPVYLLIDPWDRDGPTVTLFSGPNDGDYRHHTRVEFGKPVTVPAPFDVELDTSEFRTE